MNDFDDHCSTEDRDRPSIPDASPTVDCSSTTDRPGDRIGRYKILQLIGEGGFGTVYMAEQQEPVRRKVALKIIKLGMDTKQVIARFEAERQALALMDHPNIARVLDAGATETGRPYFVMELVRGVPVTNYCEKNKLSTTDRLELFTRICQSIQHAHHKGIIHRDLKPSNVLVTLHDGVPVPKVIDFGIAKALHQRLTEKTLFTEYHQFMGTPVYMSPEQAEMSGLDVDARTDIYSLGVLLYELLTGTTPFDVQRLKSLSHADIQKLIREESPHKPSTRIQTLGRDATSTAEHQQTDREGLRRHLKGDLDCIVMKALEKDRTRRYETANGFMFDIRRYLNGEPVLASPPSTIYRARKFVGRHRAAVGTIAGFIAVILIGLVTSLTMWRRAEAEGANAKFRLEAARAEVVRNFEEYQAVIPQLRRAQDLAALLPAEVRRQYPQDSPETTYLEATEWITGLFPTAPDGGSVTDVAALDTLTREAVLSCARHPDQPRDPVAVAWVHANREGVSRLVESTSQHRFYFGASSGGDLLVRFLLPALQEARFGAEVLCASALVHHDEDSCDLAIVDLNAALRISRYIGDGATLINALVEISCRNVIHNAYRWMVTDAVANGPLPPAYSAFLLQAPPLPDFEYTSIIEVRTLRQMLNEAFVKTNARAPARLDLARLRGLADEWGVEENPYADPSPAMIADAEALDFERALSVIKGLCDRLHIQQDASFREIRAEHTRLEQQFKDHPALNPLIPDFTRAIELRREARMNRDATLVAAAISVFRHANGGWPENIDEALAAFELEPLYRNYFGHDFIYRIVDGAPLLYAVGPNGIDDGGRGRRFENKDDRSAAGDDVLFLALQGGPVGGPGV